jgi:DNA-binding SARP family transcriptional activator
MRPIVLRPATDPLPNGYRRAVLEFRILGPVEVVGPEGLVQLGGPKQRATLAILLLNGNRVVSIDRLADELYAGRAPVTAATQVHRQISELRKVLGDEVSLETRTPGYVLHVAGEQLDLRRFERLTEEAGQALARGEGETAFELQREGLALWRGPALSDLEHEPFAQVAAQRLNELLLVALEHRLDAGLALGRHRELVSELGELTAQHPLHEAFVSRLMLALYSSGRQAEALEVYRRTRTTLSDGFGMEPGRELHELEHAILNHDPALDGGDLDEAASSEPLILVLPSSDERLEAPLAMAAALTKTPGRELLIARLLPDERALASASAALSALRRALGIRARTAAFVTVDQVADAVRLASTYDVRLVLLDALELDADIPEDVASIMERASADVGLLIGPPVDWESGDGVCVPFGGGEHDWAALELGAWLASSKGAVLRLLGVRADPRERRRDASRLLADAAIAVQRAIGIDAVPQLVDRDPTALVEAVEEATVVVSGLSAGWRREGLGDVRRALVRRTRPTLLVHSGPRPSGLAPAGTRTRFTWTIESSG